MHQRPPLVRARIGLQLQAANFVRWAAQWVREQASGQATTRLQQALTETMPLVRVVGQTRARLLERGGGVRECSTRRDPLPAQSLSSRGRSPTRRSCPACAWEVVCSLRSRDR